MRQPRTIGSVSVVRLKVSVPAAIVVSTAIAAIAISIIKDSRDRDHLIIDIILLSILALNILACIAATLNNVRKLRIVAKRGSAICLASDEYLDFPLDRLILRKIDYIMARISRRRYGYHYYQPALLVFEPVYGAKPPLTVNIDLLAGSKIDFLNAINGELTKAKPNVAG